MLRNGTDTESLRASQERWHNHDLGYAEDGKMDLAVLSMQVAHKVFDADEDADEEEFGSERTTIEDEVPSSNVSESDSRRMSNTSMESACVIESVTSYDEKSNLAKNLVNRSHAAQREEKINTRHGQVHTPPGLDQFSAAAFLVTDVEHSCRKVHAVRENAADGAECFARAKQLNTMDWSEAYQGPPTGSDRWNETRTRVVRRLPFVLHEMRRFAQFSPAPLHDVVISRIARGWNNQTWQHHDSTLHLAASFGKDGVMPLLVALGADPRAVDDHGSTALDVATAQQQWGSIWMLQRIQACQTLEEVVALADFDGGSSAMINQGFPLLERMQVAREVTRLFLVICELSKFLKVDARFSRCVRCLITLGVDHVEWSTGYTSLHLAAELGRDDLIPLLISLGAETDAVDSMGRTAIDIAEAAQHTRCVDALMMLGQYKACDGTSWVEAVERVRNSSRMGAAYGYAAR